MAHDEHLPIYKTAMDLTAYLEQVVREVGENVPGVLSKGLG